MSILTVRSNQSLERTPLGSPVLHGFTMHGVAQFGRSAIKHMRLYLALVLTIFIVAFSNKSYGDDLFYDPIALFSDVFAKVLPHFDRAKVQTTWGGFYIRADTQSKFKEEFIPSKAGLLFSVKVRDSADIPRFEDFTTSTKDQTTRNVKLPARNKAEQGLGLYYEYGKDADEKAVSAINSSIDAVIKRAEPSSANALRR